MVIAKRRNDCIDEAIKQKNEALSEIVERELSREEKDPNYKITYTLKDLNRSTPRNSTRRTGQQLTPEEREQTRQLYQQHQFEQQVQREISSKRSPEQVTSYVATSPNNWNQFQNLRTFYQPLDFSLLNRQLAEVNLDITSDSNASILAR
ncbi:hypothetical protein Glove_615g51 [Diversispora epigaea]|uniref:Uncharacterized protein n=1 Tax=Diversispora epigaea TaxID=1348612 RepID=A0A397G6E4_9GLOM|nr:hypothetical protein Glove_615g51 [Diversispora epigaea]